MPSVTAIRVYPIKSCGGVERRSADVTARGLVGDRRYMIVDADGLFLTQRRHPRLALVRITDDGAGGYLVDAPGLSTLRLPHEWPDGPGVSVTLWRDRVEATALPDELGEWFEDLLGFSCRLVHMAAHQCRAVPNDAAAFDDEVSFADAAPLLLTSEASLAELNSRLPSPPSPITMRRFRPNVVVDGNGAFEEDAWGRIAIGDTELEVAWPSTRCVLTTIDPDTGVKDPGGEPLRTLRKFRRGESGVLFGQNVIPRRLGTIRVGDAVDVLGGGAAG